MVVMVQTGAMKPFQQNLRENWGKKRSFCWNQFFSLFTGPSGVLQFSPYIVPFVSLLLTKTFGKIGSPLSSRTTRKVERTRFLSPGLLIIKQKNHLATGFGLFFSSAFFISLWAMPFYLRRWHLTSCPSKGLQPLSRQKPVAFQNASLLLLFSPLYMLSPFSCYWSFSFFLLDIVFLNILL